MYEKYQSYASTFVWFFALCQGSLFLAYGEAEGEPGMTTQDTDPDLSPRDMAQSRAEFQRMGMSPPQAAEAADMRATLNLIEARMSIMVKGDRLLRA
jgi:hypothetical protein